MAVTALAMTVTASARADKTETNQCIAAADTGQKLQDDGKLIAARESFLACSAKSCPAVVAKQCNQWLEETTRNIPSITFRARDEQGNEALGVRVLVDGATIMESIDARSLPLDPGQHTVRYELGGGRSVEDKILLRPGEKNRLVDLAFPPSERAREAKPAQSSSAPAPPQPERAGGVRVPWLGWVGLGLAVAGAATTVVFAKMANDDEGKLRSTCAPACADDDKSALDTKLTLANVGIGVGVAGLGLAIVSTIVASSASSAPKTARPGVVLSPPRGAAIGAGYIF